MKGRLALSALLFAAGCPLGLPTISLEGRACDPDVGCGDGGYSCLGGFCQLAADTTGSSGSTSGTTEGSTSGTIEGSTSSPTTTTTSTVAASTSATSSSSSSSSGSVGGTSTAGPTSTATSTATSTSTSTGGSGIGPTSSSTTGSAAGSTAGTSSTSGGGLGRLAHARTKFAAATSSDGLIYVFCAEAEDTTIEIYNPYDGGTSFSTANLPYASYGCAAATIGPTIYLAMGWSDAGATKPPSGDFFGFDPATQTLNTSLPQEPKPRASAAMTVGSDGNIYLVDGAIPSSTNTLQLFSPDSGTWSVVSSASSTAQDATLLGAAADRDGGIYAIGGLLGATGPATDSVVRYQVGSAPIFPATVASALVSEGLYGVAAVNDAEGTLYAIGGQSYAATAAPAFSAEAYSPASGLWTAMPAMVTPRFDAAATLALGRIYVLGGELDGTNVTTTTIEAFDLDSGVWLP